MGELTACINIAMDNFSTEPKYGSSLSNRGGWVVSFVTWQSSKTAILCQPSFKPHSGIKAYTITRNTFAIMHLAMIYVMEDLIEQGEQK